MTEDEAKDEAIRLIWTPRYVDACFADFLADNDYRGASVAKFEYNTDDRVIRLDGHVSPWEDCDQGEATTREVEREIRRWLLKAMNIPNPKLHRTEKNGITFVVFVRVADQVSGRL